MMLLTDEIEPGEFFDALSILDIKARLFPTPANLKKYEDKILRLDRQLHEPLITNILQSKEFRELKLANEAIFHAIEHIRDKSNSMSGYELDNLNNVRFRKKNALQQNFFGSELNEFKTNFYE